MSKFMKKVAKQFKAGQKGFTLIELLVALVIVGILAAVAIPNLANYINSGKVRAFQTEREGVQNAVMAAMAEAGLGTIVGDDLASNNDIVVVADDPSTVAVETAWITVGKYITGSTPGTSVNIQGAYTVSNAGVVTAASFPGSLTWGTAPFPTIP